MLNNASVHPTLAVTNIQRARDFYGNTLGLNEESTDENGQGVTFSCGGTQIYLYERPEPSGSTATVCSFEVDDIEAVVKNLQNNGVTFEEYDIPEMGLKTVNGIAETDDFKAAWFRDPDGNILAIGNRSTATNKQTTAVTN